VLDAAFDYVPRKPEETVLYDVVAEQLETFLARREDQDRPVPHFIEREYFISLFGTVSTWNVGVVLDDTRRFALSSPQRERDTAGVNGSRATARFIASRSRANFLARTENWSSIES
jgi:hypothetical protein